MCLAAELQPRRGFLPWLFSLCTHTHKHISYITGKLTLTVAAAIHCTITCHHFHIQLIDLLYCGCCAHPNMAI